MSRTIKLHANNKQDSRFAPIRTYAQVVAIMRNRGDTRLRGQEAGASTGVPTIAAAYEPELVAKLSCKTAHEFACAARTQRIHNCCANHLFVTRLLEPRADYNHAGKCGSRPIHLERSL